MKITSKTILVPDPEKIPNRPVYEQRLNEVEQAIKAVTNPKEGKQFLVYDMKHGNGVKPIKDQFVDCLLKHTWEDGNCTDDNNVKKLKYDVFKSNTRKGDYSAVEWETGNISSSHRAINRLFLGIDIKVVQYGFLIVPSRKLYPYLTDRIGNFSELQPYLKLWKKFGSLFGDRFVTIVEIEHDGLTKEKSLKIPKGTDGRALK